MSRYNRHNPDEPPNHDWYSGASRTTPVLTPMKIEIPATITFEAVKLIVRAHVRYWEDGEINGHEDSAEHPKMPFANGELWTPEIDLINGKVIGWPQGVQAHVHYKVCDEGEYWLVDASGRKAKYRDHYVPTSLLCFGDVGYGDYIILTIGEDGAIQHWKEPYIDGDTWEVLP